MIRGLERTQSGEGKKVESGGFTQENMSQVPFAGNTIRAQEKSSAQMRAENQARADELARKRAEVLRAMQNNNDLYDLNKTVMNQAKKMGVEPAVQLNTGSTQQAQPKKRFGLFGRR